MTLATIARAHLAAWSDRDPVAVAASVDQFTDPDTPKPLSGPELEAHAGAVLGRFGGLAVEITECADAGDTVVIAWSATAAHRETYLGIPATNGAIAFTGVDLVTRRAGVIAVTRTFDRFAVAESLGYAPRFVPADDGDRRYGISSLTPAPRADLPGALTMTWLQVRDGLEGADVDLLSVEVVDSLRASKGFLGAATVDIGDRKFTMTAFDRPESVRAVHGRPHQRAMRKFFRSGLCTGAYTSVWTPTRFSLYLRCPDCGETVSVTPVTAETPDQAACACGWTPAPEPLF